MRTPIVTAEVLAGLADLVEPELAGAGLGEWIARARCAETDPEAFFPPRNDPGKAARAICAGCEVRAPCLAYATVNADEVHGIWGGLSWAERLRLRDVLRDRRAVGRRSAGGRPGEDAALPAGVLAGA
ncbi:MAG: WhiB family transcriptional regulator, partial [Nocardiopsaceae bacterium]|nr:WhiB family transcriptional regulator [Nocardiopsaceae bacterium]